MKFTKILESIYQHWIICIHFIFCQYFSILGEKIDQAEFIAYQDSFNAFDSNNNGRISHKSLQVNIVKLRLLSQLLLTLVQFITSLELLAPLAPSV